MNSDKPTYKACKHCQKNFLQNEIFNHQRSCNSKSKEIQKSNSSQPQINVPQQQIQQEPIHQSISQQVRNLTNIQNNYSDQSSNVNIHLSQQILEKFKGKVQILDIKPLPIEESMRYQQEQSQYHQQQQSIQQQFSQQEVYNQKHNQEQHNQEQSYSYQKSEINQLDLSRLIKCEHCNCLLNHQDKEYHEMNCSSLIRFNNLIKEESSLQIQLEEEQPYDNTQIDMTNAQKIIIIAHYLKIHCESKDIILQGKKLLDGAVFKSLNFKKTFDQRTCYFCRNYFKEDEIIYNVECCLLKCHKQCLHNMIKKSTKCYNCQKELFPTKVKVKK